MPASSSAAAILWEGLLGAAAMGAEWVGSAVPVVRIDPAEGTFASLVLVRDGQGVCVGWFGMNGVSMQTEPTHRTYSSIPPPRHPMQSINDSWWPPRPCWFGMSPTPASTSGAPRAGPPSLTGE